MGPLQNDGIPQAPVPAQTHPGTRQDGKIGWLFLWLIGVPVPLLLLFFLLRGCT